MNQTQNNLQGGCELPQFKHAFIKLPIKVKHAYRLNHVYDVNNLEILMTKCGYQTLP
jgi:hypothetical protein